MTLEERLARMIEPLPDGASVLLPVATVRSWLEATGQGDDSSRPLSDLTIQDVADELDRSPSTVRGWLIAGDIPEAYKLQGREWRIPRGALRAFLDRQANGDGNPGRGTGRRSTAKLSDWRRQA